MKPDGESQAAALGRSGARGRARWWVAGAAALAAIAVLVAIASTRTTSAGSSSARAVGGARGGSGQPGERVPGFVIASIDGASVRVPSGGPGALFFTTASCESCIPSSKALGVLKRRFGARAEVLWVSISPSDTIASVRAFQRAVGNPPYRAALDTSGALARSFRVTALGTAVVYDARGRVVFRGDEPQLPALKSAFAKAGLA
jgi:hypothetical protein